MEKKWTKQQADAIEARGGGLLISAAAGSGKTAVLTERIIRRLVDRSDPTDADRFLVVTFTRAAAAEMRSRIGDRLRELIRRSPDDLFLQRQLTLLQQTLICTMDSFFLNLAKENFERLGISQNLRVADEAMLSTMTADCLEALLEESYQQPTDGFLALVRSFSDENDRMLSAEVLRLYKKLRSLPYPRRWMDEQLALYRDPPPADKSAWGEILLKEAEDALRRGMSAARQAIACASADPVLQKQYLPALSDDLAALQDAHAALRSGWDAAVKAVQGVSFGRLGPARGCDPALKERASGLRDQVKEELKTAQAALLCTEAEYREDMAMLAPQVEALFGLTWGLWQRIDRAKADAAVADFSDFAYLALQLLADADGNPTPFAKEYAERFDEILLDEYQDTNQMQDLIFSCISKGGQNLFLVGDLKQSIYRFRSASPEVFMEKKDRFALYDGTHFPALLPLSSNFRSRREITEAVNYIFSKTMSRQVGNVDYNGQEQLNCGASWYPPLPESSAPAVSLLLVDLPQDDGDEEPRVLSEARAAAAKIKEMIQNGEPVTENGSLRPCRGGDFALLMRSGRDTAQIYASALKEEGVDAVLSASEGYFSSREVMLMVSLLRVLDNPLLDIPMAAVLLSPVFGFDCDQVAALSADWPEQSLYGALIRQSAGRNPEKAAKASAFLSLFGSLRTKAASMGIGQFIQYVYDATDFVEVMNRFSDSAAREANLRLLLKYAGDYAASGSSELSGFVAYLDALMERGEDFEAANPSPQTDESVQLMTIHRSKGLQFPIVVLANCGKRHNLRDLNDPVAASATVGFGMKRVDRDKLQSFPTLPLQAIRCKERQDLVSEEMRLLYVALTRAEERLLIVCSDNKMPNSLQSLSGQFDSAGAYPPESAAQAKRYSDWLLAALLQHPDCRALKLHYGLDLPEAAASFPLGTCLVKQLPAPAPKGQKTVPAANPVLVAELEKRVNWRYPHPADTHTPAKTAVTRIAHHGILPELSPPAFAREQGFTASEKGSIFHRALQFADFRAGAFDPEEELMRLTTGGWLTKAESESIDKEEFADFFQSSLMARMLRAEKLLREFRFFDQIPASKAGFEGSGQVLIQGIADCVMIEKGKAVIIDFKTDRVNHVGKLAERYRSQLDLYRQALEKAFPKGVAGCLIYSTCLRQTVDPFVNTK